MPLDEKQIRALAGPAYFSRGVDYFRQGLVSGVRPIANGIAARVKGSRWYEVEIALRPGAAPQYFCSCPIGLDGDFCKHCVAVSLRWLQQPEIAALANPTKPKASEAKAVRAAFEKAVQARGWNGYVAYFEVREWTARVQRAITRLAGMTVGDEVSEVPAICEWALEQLEEAFSSVDDQADETIDLERQIFQIFVRACQQLRPDPLELAGRLLNLQKRFPYGAFDDLFPEFNGILGESGVAEYRRLLEIEIKSASPSVREHLEYLFTILNRHFRDFDSLSKHLTKDLRSLRQYLPVIELYRDAGRIQEAAEWADRGFKAYRDEYDPDVIKTAADLYHQLDRGSDAVQLMWNCFYAKPSLERYQDLKQHAEKVSLWPEWRVRALLEVRMRIDQAIQDGMDVDHTVLVEIFLFERDVEAAWLEAKQGGCQSSLWVRLARSRAKDHPEESGMTLLAQGEKAVRDARNSRYEDGVSLLVEAASLMQKAGRALDFAERLRAFRDECRQRPALVRTLDRHRRQLLF